MKNSKFLFANLKYLIETSSFKAIFLLLICACGYVVLVESPNASYLDALLACLVNPWFILLYFLIVMMTTITTYNIFDKNLSFIIRLNSKKKYLLYAIKSVLLNNFCVFLLGISLLITGMNLFVKDGFIIYEFDLYKIKNIIYIIFYLIRFIILIELFSILLFVLLKLFNSKIVYVLYIYFPLSLQWMPYKTTDIISSLNNFYWYFGEYFRFHFYSSFNLEIIFSLLFLFIMIFLIFILLYILIKKEDDVIQ